jgi:hypothetical protein
VNHLEDPVKRLVRRFVSLPPNVRVRVAANLLRWRDEHEQSERVEGRQGGGGPRGKSFLEQFWDEVEAAHGDGLFQTNPFAEESPGLGADAARRAGQGLVHLSC